jgi:hypothetical protein
MHTIALRRHRRVALVSAFPPAQAAVRETRIASPREEFRAEAAECLELANGWSGLIKDQYEELACGCGWPGKRKRNSTGGPLVGTESVPSADCDRAGHGSPVLLG